MTNLLGKSLLGIVITFVVGSALVAQAPGATADDRQAIAGLLELVLRSESPILRDQAMAKLVANHGSYATPALVQVIGDPDEDVAADRAILALAKIGASAVLPLVEVLNSDNELMRRNAGLALSQIADQRSASALVRMARDQSEAVRYVANQALQALGISAGTDPVALCLDQARICLDRERVGGGASNQVLWSLVDDALVCVNVPAPIYYLEIAKRYAEDARRQDPASEEALVLLARSYLGQAATIEEYDRLAAENEDMQALVATVPGLRRVAMATGPAILRRVLGESIQNQEILVAVMAIEALAETETSDSLATSPLLTALQSGDARITYAAALAISQVAAGSQIPDRERVIATLARAVSEESIRLVKVVASELATAAVVRAADSSLRGLAVDAVGTGQAAIRDIQDFPNYDVVVISDDLPDLEPLDVIALIRRHNPSIKILLLTTAEDAAAKFADSVDGILLGPLRADVLLARVDEVCAEVAPGDSRARAERIAIAASEALFGLARAGVDVRPAITSLVAQLDRVEAVAVPAALAIGAGGDVTTIAPLLAMLASEDADLPMLRACAQALGGLLSRADRLPRGCYATLLTIATDVTRDASLRTSVVTALGRARLSPGERLKLTEVLKTVAAIK